MNFYDIKSDNNLFSYSVVFLTIILLILTSIVPIIFAEDFHNSTQKIPTGIDRIDAEPVFGKPNSTDIDVAILDSGVDAGHPDLNVLVDKQVNFVGIDPSDNCGHGTHIAGIIGAKHNEFGVVGVAPDARIWNVKVMEKNNITDPDDECVADYDAVIKGLNYLLENSEFIDAANLSFSFVCDDFCNETEAVKIEDLINQIISKGVVVIVSAGNDGKDAKTIVPAMFQSPITVSAVSDTDGKCGGLGPVSQPWEKTGERYRDDTFAYISNNGVVIDISAPGVDILSTLPGGKYGNLTGTSMATPHVTGTVALMMANNPGITPSIVRNMLLESAIHQSIECDGQGYGYIYGDDKDPYSEPLVYTKKFK